MGAVPLLLCALSASQLIFDFRDLLISMAFKNNLIFEHVGFSVMYLKQLSSESLMRYIISVAASLKQCPGRELFVISMADMQRTVRISSKFRTLIK